MHVGTVVYLFCWFDAIPSQNQWHYIHCWKVSLCVLSWKLLTITVFLFSTPIYDSCDLKSVAMATTLLTTAIHLSSWVPAATSNHFTVYYKHHTHSLVFRQQSTTHTHTHSCESRHIPTYFNDSAKSSTRGKYIRNTYYCYACSPDWNIMLSST